jgi:hypothetical protein
MTLKSGASVVKAIQTHLWIGHLFTMGIAVLALAIAPAAHAATVAATTTNSGSQGCCGDFSLGWQFTVNVPIKVTDLGRLDSEGDGSFASATARLYNWNTGAALATTTIVAGVGGEVNGNYTNYYAPITPTVLTPGTEYLVAVETRGNDALAGEDYVFDVAITLAPELNYSGFGRATQQGFSGVMPATATQTVGSFVIVRGGSLASASYFGANFKYTVIPEPATYTMLLLVLSVTGLTRQSRSRQQIVV